MKSQESRKSRDLSKLPNLGIRGLCELAIFGKFCMHDQLFSWPTFPMIKDSNQFGLNMKVVLLYLSFK